MCNRCGFLLSECRCVSDEAAVELAESADAFLRSLVMGCKCGHGWHEGVCGATIASSEASIQFGRPNGRECHCSVFIAASDVAMEPASDLKVWCPECSLNFIVGQTVQDYSCPNCHAALLPRV